jgi:hypothetical protein
MCLGPITPAVAIVLLPLIPNDVPPLSTMDDKLTDVLAGIVLAAVDGVSEGGRISNGSSMSESSLVHQSAYRPWYLMEEHH